MSVSAIDISKCLSGINFPANKQGLINHARQKNSSQEVIDILQKIPDREYTNMADVEQGFGQVK